MAQGERAFLSLVGRYQGIPKQEASRIIIDQLVRRAGSSSIRRRWIWTLMRSRKSGVAIA